MLPAALTRPGPLFAAAIALRVVFLLYGLWQDAHSPMKFTDIDYMVFTDAARFVAGGHSPYARDTYRYTPLLAWLLLPTAAAHGRGDWVETACFSFGKVLFAAADIVAGWLIVQVLRMPGARDKEPMTQARALGFASLWLLNPMVATISTRGSSEGLLCVMVVALLWAVLKKQVVLAGAILGLAVHFKIYPFIYAASIVWWMDDETSEAQTLKQKALGFFNAARIKLAIVSLATFASLNAVMYYMYGFPFVQHTYLHHLTRIDHRHNFSPYNTLLYISSSRSASFSPVDTLSSLTTAQLYNLESLAFLPQLLLSAVLIPLLLAKKSLPSTMLAQTFAFVTFNKVCTSQYFLWYLIFLPFYLPTSSLLARPRRGLAALGLWIATQAAWLQQGFELEFLGRSTFVPGLWMAGIAFFLANAWILGIVVADVGGVNGPRRGAAAKA